MVVLDEVARGATDSSVGDVGAIGALDSGDGVITALVATGSGSRAAGTTTTWLGGMGIGRAT